MGNKLHNLFSSPNPKEDLPFTISFLLIIVGLVIQIVVIVWSFFWTPEQFGLPTTTPSLYIIFTVLGLIPILGYIAFANYFLIFTSTFHGSNVFNHPNFYHLVGMAIFLIGATILFKFLDSAGKSKRQSVDRERIITPTQSK